MRTREVDGEHPVGHLVLWALKPTREQLTEPLAEGCLLPLLDETWYINDQLLKLVFKWPIQETRIIDKGV